MNTRFLLYGLVALVLVLALGGGGADEDSPLTFNLRQQAAFKNECMKEVIGFEQPTRSKFRFCDCVVARLEKLWLGDAAFPEAYVAFIERYLELSQSPKKASRVLASRTQDDFRTGFQKFDILLSNKNMRHPFTELVEEAKPLNETVEKSWKTSMLECSRLP